MSGVQEELVYSEFLVLLTNCTVTSSLDVDPGQQNLCIVNLALHILQHFGYKVDQSPNSEGWLCLHPEQNGAKGPTFVFQELFLQSSCVVFPGTQSPLVAEAHLSVQLLQEDPGWAGLSNAHQVGRIKNGLNVSAGVDILNQSRASQESQSVGSLGVL